MPDPAPVYRNRFWYKITCVEPERGNVSTFKEAGEIIAAIHNVLDGWPQIPMLTAWSFEGIGDSPVNMDLMGFGGMESVENHAGTAEDIRELADACQTEFNAVLSYHLNVDDSYREYPGWDDTIICRDPYGDRVPWINMFGRTGFHISHTLDVESGKVFERLDRFRNHLPLAEAVHLDAFRNTNMHWSEDAFISMVDELECGVNPIIDYFTRSGIAVSIEGARQMPMQQTGWISAFWHMSRLSDFPARAVLFHGKAIGGGIPGCPARVAHAFGTSIDTDVCYHPNRHPLSLSLLEDWDRIVDLLYLGFLHYQFCLQFELLSASRQDDHFILTYADGLTTSVQENGDTLVTKWNHLLIAKDDTRMLPFPDSLYLYSREEGMIERELPAEWLTKGLSAHALDRAGRQPFTDWRICEGRIQIRLKARQPVVFRRTEPT
jgi:hypothetical protein